MNKLRKLALACAFSIVAPAASAASVSGLDFESGGLGSWIGSGTAVHDPLMAYQGDCMDSSREIRGFSVPSV